MLLFRMQQMQQLQQAFSFDDTQDSSDSTGLTGMSFGDILTGLLSQTSQAGGDSYLADSLGLGSLNLAQQNPNSTNPQQKTDQLPANLTDLESVFNYFAAQYNLNPDLLKSVAKAESNFDPSAVSPVGALGIMQLMPATARSLGVNNPLNATENIAGGAKYLSSLLERFDGNVPLAVAAYNAGPGAVKKYGGIPPYKETQKYVAKVMDNLVDYIG